jgi:HD-GYP domain-containing protein (c-di-GMP phosphodiesterase class II)
MKAAWRISEVYRLLVHSNSPQGIRKQAILQMILSAVGVALLVVTFMNLSEWVITQNAGTILYLASDLICLLLVAGIWQLNRERRTRTASYLLLIGLTVLPSLAFSLPDVDHLLLIYAIPVITASFLLNPSCSFFFAGLSTLFYTLAYFNSPEPFAYNYLSIIAIFVLAAISWLISKILNRTLQELLVSYDATIGGWAQALELRDKETIGHARRVMELTLDIARKLNIPEEDLVHIRRGVLLHDIGKMGIPDNILLKAGPLSSEEWNIMQMHPSYAFQVLDPIPFLQPALDIPYCHHERWDGSGYPRGLRGSEIPLPARIFAVVDVWDALTHDRYYRPAWPENRAEEYLRQQSGVQFDPQVVQTFFAVLKEKQKDPAF